MTIGQDMLPEFDEEMAGTRRILERIPSDKGEWKPHPKSFSLAHLAQLVAWMPGWLTQIINNPELDLKQFGGYSVEKTETLLAMFEKNVTEARVALGKVTDAELANSWSLKMGDQVLMTLPKKAVLRQTVNHLVHHRAQLTVYLRLIDVPVPGLYGPSADEKGATG